MKYKFRFAHPGGGNINPYTHNSLLYNIWELGASNIDLDDIYTYEEYPLSAARNKILEDFVTCDSTHLLMYDDDTVFPRGTILRLLTANKPIVSGWYFSRKGNLGLVVFGRKPGKKLLSTDDFSFYYPLSLRELISRKDPPTSSQARVDGVGAGCLLFTKEACEKLIKKSDELGYPIFAEWTPLLKKNIHAFGEDLYFGDFCAMAEVPLYVEIKAMVAHFAKQGFIIGKKHLQARMMQEGIIEFDLSEFS